MKIVINNKTTETQSSNLLQISEELSLPDKGVAIAVNNRMVPRTEWATTALAENDNIVIIKAACGG